MKVEASDNSKNTVKSVPPKENKSTSVAAGVRIIYDSVFAFLLACVAGV